MYDVCIVSMSLQCIVSMSLPVFTGTCTWNDNYKFTDIKPLHMT